MTPLDAPAHLLLIDEDARLRDLLRQYLKGQGFLVSVARDTDHARRLLGGLEFDLVLLDNALPDAADLSATLAAPVLCLTSKGTKPPAQATSIAKPFEPKALCETIYGILDRRPQPGPPKPKTLTLGTKTFDIETATLTDQGNPVALTATEVRLMRIFASNPGQPMGRGDLVARLGREGLHAKARAIDVQITRLRRKLEDDPKNPRFLQTVRGAGYMLVVD
ncbi:MAG TPA: response regulator [Rhodobacterales bacterium]|nr:response regulator [Rhodobacterales bacterium]